MFAFSIEPAVFIYNTRLLPRAAVPRGHLGLIQAMLADHAAWHGPIGTALLAPPPGAVTLGTIDKGRDAMPPVLDSSLLALRDRARRNRFTSEWRRAMRPSGAAEVTVLRKR